MRIGDQRSLSNSLSNPHSAIPNLIILITRDRRNAQAVLLKSDRLAGTQGGHFSDGLVEGGHRLLGDFGQGAAATEAE